MRQLEQRYESEILVIGVHSGKYHAERVTERIRDASFRLDSKHPIVNDRQFRVWRSYAINAWPTLVVIDPEGYVAGARAGEFTAEMLSMVIDAMIEAADAKNALDRSKRVLPPDAASPSNSQLRYPGKITLDGSRVAIADSGNNRILVGVLSSDERSIAIEREIGGREGFADGPQAAFNFPQGVRFKDDKLYVADAGNHAIREINLKTNSVSTIAGTGNQMRSLKDLEEGALSSPWDVEIHGRTIYAAMAGRHQIWSMDLDSRRMSVHAGLGAEDIRDGINSEALLAQPMGLVAAPDGLYFADAESNAIRMTSFSATGDTRTIVGTGLFDFGDVDGTGEDVRMQHPQGIAVAPNGKLLVADSYNDALKWLDPITRSATTWVKGLHEPNGLACGSSSVFVADTNAHRIVKVSYENAEVIELSLG